MDGYLQEVYESLPDRVLSVVCIQLGQLLVSVIVEWNMEVSTF